MTNRLYAAAFLLLFSACAFAQQTAAPPQPVQKQKAPLAPLQKAASIEGVTEYRLANGLRVLTVPDPGSDTTTVHIAYLVARVTRAMARKAWRTCSSTCCSKGRSATPT